MCQSLPFFQFHKCILGTLVHTCPWHGITTPPDSQKSWGGTSLCVFNSLQVQSSACCWLWQCPQRLYSLRHTPSCSEVWGGSSPVQDLCHLGEHQHGPSPVALIWWVQWRQCWTRAEAPPAQSTLTHRTESRFKVYATFYWKNTNVLYIKYNLMGLIKSPETYWLI